MMNYSPVKKLITSFLLGAGICTLLLGCAKEEVKEEEIVLVAPVGIPDDYEEVIYRDLIEADVHSSMVAPLVEEYAFTKDQVFEKYNKIPGEYVERGDILVYAENKETRDKLEDINDNIESLELNHTLEIANLNKDIDSSYENETKIGHVPQAEERARQNTLRLEQQKKESNELFFLEHEKLEKKKALVETKNSNANIKSGVSGTIVNAAFVYGGDSVQKDVPLVAVGDISTKIIKTDYISKSTIGKALDVYAVINGKRYEIDYEVVEPEEVTIMKKNNESTFTTFVLSDPENEVAHGSYATVVVVKDARSGVLCVPNNAIKFENDNYYVYVKKDDGSSAYTQIETGMKDGFYTEVLSGLNLHDKVLSNSAPAKGKTVANLEYGTCSVPYDTSGYLFYPFSEWISNPVDTGKVYVKELLVEDYEPVVKGQTLAVLEVIQDEVEINRCETRKATLNTRIAETLVLKEKNNELEDPYKSNDKDRNFDKEINRYQKEIIELDIKLKKLRKYSGIINITAPVDGFISDKGKLKEGDLIYPDTRILQFSDSSQSYIVVKDESQALSFGNKANIEFNSASVGANNGEGTVVTVGYMSLSKKMAKDYTLITVPEQMKALLSGGERGNGGGFSRNSFKVHADTREMNNVILIPKPAVMMQGGSTYVKVINDDGSVTLQSFLAGGSNINYYWAIEGLSEGTQICYD